MSVLSCLCLLDEYTEKGKMVIGGDISFVLYFSDGGRKNNREKPKKDPALIFRK